MSLLGFTQAQDGDAQKLASGNERGKKEAPAVPKPPPEAAARLKEIEERLRDSWDRLLVVGGLLESGDRKAQDETLAEAIQLAREALAIREKHQGRDSRGERGEWWEVANARWVIRTLQAIVAMDDAQRVAYEECCQKYSKGTMLNAQRRYNEASSLLQDAVAIARRLFSGDHPDVAALTQSLASVLRARGEIAKAELLYSEALEMRRRLYSGDHPDVGASLNSLALLLAARGDDAGAEPLYREALDMGRRLFAGDHRDVATCIHNLANVLRARRDIAGAEPLYREALEMRRRLYSGDHPDIATSLSYLAVLLQERGKVADAELLCREELEMRRRLYSGDHPDIATSLSNLGSVLHARRDFAGAEPLFREALGMRRRLFSDHHPDVARVLGKLARLLQDRGDLTGAEQLYREALDIRRFFAGDDANIATILDNLATLLNDRGDLSAAEPFFREALDVRRRLFSGDHIAIAASLGNLASLLQDRGDLAGAERLFREALDMWRRLFPGPHPDVATSLNNLACLLQLRGDLAAAEPLHREALDMRRRFFPDDDPNVAAMLGNLASALKDRGDFVAAEPLYREALDMWRRLFPGDHRDVAGSLNSLAVLLQGRRELSASEALFREALDMQRRLLTGDHPNVAMYIHNLASVLKTRGDVTGAESLYREALDMQRRLFSGDHPNVAASLNNLAVMLQDRGDVTGAELLYREALDMRRRLYSSDHPDVSTSTHNLGSVLKARGDFTGAACLFKEALEIAERLRPLIIGEERARAEFAQVLGIPGLAVHYGEVLLQLDRPAEAFSVIERGRARALLDLLDRSSIDVAEIARDRAGAGSKARGRLEAALTGEERARIDLTTAEALAESLQRERKKTIASQGLDAEERARRLADVEPKIATQLEHVKTLRRALSDAGAAVLVELRGLFPETRPLPVDAVLDALPDGDLILSYLWSGNALVLATGGEGMAEGAILADTEERVKTLRALIGSVRASIVKPLVRSDPRATGELLSSLLPVHVRERAMGARRLVVLPDGPLNDLPFDVLLASAEEVGLREKPVVVAASATVYIQCLEAARQAAQAASRKPAALILADPVYERDPIPEPKYPGEGALIIQVLPESSAASMGLRRGDVILAYAGHKIDQFSGLNSAIAEISKAAEDGDHPLGDVTVSYWREGQEHSVRMKPGRLGVKIATSDPASGLRSLARSARGLEGLSAEASATDQVRLFGGNLGPLPGTRREALAIAGTFRRAGGEAEILLREDATVGKLSAGVRGRPILHLATHGLMGSAARPHDASLALTRPKEISPQDIGFLRLDDLLRDWRSKLDGTRLVVLSACDTGRGATVGDSAMALPWGFFFAGARTVVASLWRVDDEATALLMARFYENLLGTFEKPRKIGGEEYAPGKALHVEPALREAKAWLRSLSRVEAEAERKRLSDLAEGFEKTIAAKDGQSALVPSRGPGGEVDAPTVRTPVGERPYAHPYFWAAFVCVGSPE